MSAFGHLRGAVAERSGRRDDFFRSAHLALVDVFDFSRTGLNFREPHGHAAMRTDGMLRQIPRRG